MISDAVVVTSSGAWWPGTGVPWMRKCRWGSSRARLRRAFSGPARSASASAVARKISARTCRYQDRGRDLLLLLCLVGA